MKYDWWLTPSAMMAVYLVQLEARLERAKSRGNALVFRGPVLLRLMLIVCLVVLPVFVVMHWDSRDPLPGICLLFFSFILVFVWPAAFVVDDAGLRRILWWKPVVMIPWKDVAEIEKNAAGDVMVIGMGSTLTFSRFHVDPERFEKEISKRSGKLKINKPKFLIDLNIK